MKEFLEQLLQQEGLAGTEKKQAIVLATIELMSEKGYEGVATSEIAKRAGVAEGTIFRHFKTKKDLLHAIIAPTFTSLIAPALIKSFKNQILTKEYVSFEAFVHAVIMDRFNTMQKATPLLKILVQEIMFDREMRKALEDLFYEHAFSSFEKIIVHFQEKGEIVLLPTMTIFRILITNMLGYFIPRCILYPEKHWNDDEELQFVEQSIVKALSVEKKAT